MGQFLEGGAIAGIANGLKEGLITGMTVRNMQNQQQMAMAMNGLVKDENGNIVPSPQKQRQIDAQNQGLDLQSMQNKRAMGLLTGGSNESLERVHGLQQAFDASHAGDRSYHGPKGADIFGEGMSGASAEDLAGKGLIGKDVSGEYGMLKAMYNPLVAVKQGQLDVSRDNQAAGAVDKVTNDSQLKSHTQRIQGANRILGQLDAAKSGKIVDTNQLLNDINTEYVALLTGANNPALGKQERTEYSTYAGNMSALIQKITGDPKSINSPEVLKQLETQVRDLRSNYQGQVGTRAKMLQRTYQHNPAATQAQAQKIQEITSELGTPEPIGGGGLMGGGAGKIKVSNGKESFLIDPKDLADAAKDGFQQVK